MSRLRISSIRFSRYKAFEDFQVALQEFNVLVGPNNAGKSTVIGAIRILAEGLRIARAKSAELLDISGYRGRGHRLNISELQVAAENIFFGYDESEPAQVSFRLSNGNHLRLYFPERGSCFLIPESTTHFARTPTEFRRHFDIDVGFVPILGPVEHRERLYQREAARQALQTSGASRNFRNIWYHYPDDFEKFRELIRLTWPGMDIERPEISGDGTELAMFCPEERHPREICWAGYGFQVWCQMLTHIVKSSGASLLTIDEPDIYLHSDLQRQLVALLRDLGPDVVIATHSTEIIAECDPSNLLNVNKKNRSAQRVKDISQLKRLFSTLGSNLNPTLTQLAKTRRVVFVEGLDFQILSVFARTLGNQRVANRSDFAVVAIEGFNPKRAVDLGKGIEAAVGGKVAKAVVLDRDYRSDSEIKDVTADLLKSGFEVHVHARKELENYLLNAKAITKAVESRLLDRARRSGETTKSAPDIGAILTTAVNAHRLDTFSQRQAREFEFIKRKTAHLDMATVTADIAKRFEAAWENIDGRLCLIPGKEVLANVNAELQKTVGLSVSDGFIAQQFTENDIDSDLKELVGMLGKFAKSDVPD